MGGLASRAGAHSQQRPTKPIANQRYRGVEGARSPGHRLWAWRGPTELRRTARSLCQCRRWLTAPS